MRAILLLCINESGASLARQAARALGVKTGGTQAELLRFLSPCLGIPRGSMSAETCLLLPESKYSSASLDDKSILIVDDDFRNIFTLNLVFEASGCSVIYAESASAALEKLATHPGVDLVLMDVMMPDMDGNEAIKEIRKNTKLDDLAIIALTAKATPEDKQASLDAGANAYVSKPFDTTYLLALAEACMNATDRHAKSRDSQARTSPATA